MLHSFCDFNYIINWFRRSCYQKFVSLSSRPIPFHDFIRFLIIKNKSVFFIYLFFLINRFPSFRLQYEVLSYLLPNITYVTHEIIRKKKLWRFFKIYEREFNKESGIHRLKVNRSKKYFHDFILLKLNT